MTWLGLVDRSGAVSVGNSGIETSGRCCRRRFGACNSGTDSAMVLSFSKFKIG